jgi:hypothetical protein
LPSGKKQAKKGWLGIAPSQPLNFTPTCPLAAVVIILMMLVRSMASVVVRPPSIVIRSVIWRTAVVAVVAARVIPISRVSVGAVTISGIAEADSDSSDPD